MRVKEDKPFWRRLWVGLIVAAALITAFSTVASAGTNRPLRYYDDNGRTAMTYYTNGSANNDSYWGINTDDPQCELDINGTVCINRTGVYYRGVNITGGGAPTTASYVTLGLDGGLSSERVLTAGRAITLIDTGANGIIQVNVSTDVCTSGNYSSFNGSKFVCSPDQNSGSGGGISGVTINNGTGINVSGNGTTFTIGVANLQACNSVTEYSVWNGSHWLCDNDGGGTTYTFSNTDGLVNLSGSPSLIINLNLTAMDLRYTLKTLYDLFTSDIYTNVTALQARPTGNITGNGVANSISFFTNSTNINATNIAYSNTGSTSTDTTLITFNSRGRVGYNGSRNAAVISGLSGKDVELDTDGANRVEITYDKFFNIKNISDIYYYGIQDEASTTPTEMHLVGSNGVAPTGIFGDGGLYRASIRFWSNYTGTADPNLLPLTISTHLRNFSDPGDNRNHVSFYSNLINNSYAGKAFEWQWGNESDGKLYLRNLNVIELPESFTGFYQNESNTGSGIDSKDNVTTIDIDSDGDQSGDSFVLSRNGRTAEFMRLSDSNSNNYINFGTNRAWLYFNASPGFFDMYAGSGKQIRFLSNTLEAARIDTSGRFGINTTSARHTLDVNGTANISLITYTPQLCLNGDCRTAWPTGGAGGGNFSEFRVSNTTSTTTLYNNSLLTIQAGSNVVVDQTAGTFTISASVTGGSGNISGNGTSGYVGVWNSANTLTTANLQANNTRVTIGETSPAELFINGYNRDQYALPYATIATTEFCEVGAANNIAVGGFRTVLASSGVASSTTGEAEHPCVTALLDSTTANGGAWIMTALDGIVINGTENTTAIWKRSSNTKAGQVTARQGFHDTAAITEPTDGCYWQFNFTTTTNVAYTQCRSNSVNTVNATTFAPVNNTWYITNVEILPNAAAAVFRAWNENGTLILNTTVSTNIPTGSARVTGAGFGISENATSSSTTIGIIDYMDFKIGRRVRNIPWLR